jgi:hypothetical protein
MNWLLTFVALAMLWLLLGCGQVHGNAVEMGAAVCEANGGLQYIRQATLTPNHFVARCRNGATFDNLQAEFKPRPARVAGAEMPPSK